MTLIIALLAASIMSSIMVVAAGMLSSRVSRTEEQVETYYYEMADEETADVLPQAAE